VRLDDAAAEPVIESEVAFAVRDRCRALIAFIELRHQLGDLGAKTLQAPQHRLIPDEVGG
jgi:hypothetical protein